MPGCGHSSRWPRPARRGRRAAAGGDGVLGVLSGNRWPPKSACRCWSATAEESDSPVPASATPGTPATSWAWMRRRPRRPRRVGPLPGHDPAGCGHHRRRAPAANRARLVPVRVSRGHAGPRSRAEGPGVADAGLPRGRPGLSRPPTARSIRPGPGGQPELAGGGRHVDAGRPVRPGGRRAGCCGSRARGCAPPRRRYSKPWRSPRPG